MFRSRVFVFFLILLFLMAFAGICIWLVFSNKKSEIIIDGLSEASYVQIFNGKTGTQIMVSEKIAVELIKENLSNVKLEKLKRQGKVDGFLYSIKIFNEENILIWSGTINDKDTVIINNIVYKTNRPFNMELFDK